MRVVPREEVTPGHGPAEMDAALEIEDPRNPGRIALRVPLADLPLERTSSEALREVLLEGIDLKEFWGRGS